MLDMDIIYLVYCLVNRNLEKNKPEKNIVKIKDSLQILLVYVMQRFKDSF